MATTTAAPQLLETQREVGLAPHTRPATQIAVVGAQSSEDVFIQLADGTVYNLCKRCGGHGHITFSSLDGARCWTCHTTGLGTLVGNREAMLAIATRRARDREAYARRKAAKEDAAKAAFAAWADQHTALLTALAPYAAEDGDAALRQPALAGLARQARVGRRPLSNKQLTLVADLLARDAEDQIVEQRRRAAARYAAPVGEQATVTGTVKVAMDIDTRYGYCRLVIVEGAEADEGVTVKVFGNSKGTRAVQRGDRITITGTVKAHETYDDAPQTVLARPQVR